MIEMSSQKELNSASPAAAAWGQEFDAAAIEAAAREARARELARLIGVAAGKVKTALNAVFVAPLARWRKREALANELYSLDERMLKDIGLSRSEIPFIVSGDRVATPHQDNRPARAA
jgi:uncharacterized protein YjiS (DUF1127 family)